ncbi:MAG: hypothetical protein RSA79_02280 [Oscillospiraceae bacterium]
MNKLKKAGIIILIVGTLLLALGIIFIFSNINGGSPILIISIIINIVGLNLATYKKK